VVPCQSPEHAHNPVQSSLCAEQAACYTAHPTPATLPTLFSPTHIKHKSAFAPVLRPDTPPGYTISASAMSTFQAGWTHPFQQIV